MIIIILLLLIVFYLLYINGYLITQVKKAAMFVGKIGGNGMCRAKFSYCSGYIKRIVKFKESREYDFTLNSDLSIGEFTAELIDSSKHIIFKLDCNHPCGFVIADSKARYYLILRFKSASGNFELKWN